MLSVSRPQTAGNAERYHSRDDYYLSEPGQWQGRGAEALGLSADVQKEDFQAVLRGFSPQDGSALVPSKGDVRRAGVDLTFSAPKSVSLLSVADPAVQEAHAAAVAAVLDYAERHNAQTREQVDGKRVPVRTESLVVAKFTHMTSRELDPQLHTHAFVVNLTQKDGTEWRALRNDSFYRDQRSLGRLYRLELSHQLQSLGYSIRVTDREQSLFEVAGVPDELLTEFSKRRGQIEEQVRELRATGRYKGASEARLHEIAALGTRAQKEGGLSRDVLHEHWSGVLRERGYTFEDLREGARREAERERGAQEENAGRAPKAVEAVRAAAQIKSETESVFPRKDVLDLAAKFTFGERSLSELEEALVDLQSARFLIPLGEAVERREVTREVLTTHTMHRMERRILGLVRHAKGQYEPISSLVEVDALIAEREASQPWRYSEGQKAAARTLLASRDSVNLVQGDAGTGKTASLALVREMADRKGVQVVGLGFTGKAASELEQGAGIPSRTVDSFLASGAAQEIPEGSLVILDEATMAGSRHFFRLLKAAEERRLKVVIVGDKKQFASIAAGRNHALLQERAGVDQVRMTEVLRQKTEHTRAAVGAISRGKTDRALAELEKRGAFRALPEAETRLEAVVNEYLQDRSQGRDVLLLTSTNANRLALNEQIRDRLVEADHLERGRLFPVLEPASFTPEESSLAASYPPGQKVLVRSRLSPDLPAGVMAEVSGVNAERNRITVAAGSASQDVDLMREYGKLSPFRSAERPFASGDRVVFVKNDRALAVQNGLQGTVRGVDERGNMTVQDERGRFIRFRLSEGHRSPGDALYGYNFITHAYAVTEYKSQGATVDKVIWHADASKVRLTRNAFYVAATRARNDFTVYTNDKTEFRKQVRHPQEKTSTLDYARAGREPLGVSGPKDRDVPGQDTFRERGLSKGGPVREAGRQLELGR